MTTRGPGSPMVQKRPHSVDPWGLRSLGEATRVLGVALEPQYMGPSEVRKSLTHPAGAGPVKLGSPCQSENGACQPPELWSPTSKSASSVHCDPRSAQDRAHHIHWRCTGKASFRFWAHIFVISREASQGWSNVKSRVARRGGSLIGECSQPRDDKANPSCPVSLCLSQRH